ncbi:MAG: hypothetical protein H6726_14185 [Sandaracinaceae bacterium]|nr:hypothetical protein [Sandaracinaceae bacterium]
MRPLDVEARGRGVALGAFRAEGFGGRAESFVPTPAELAGALEEGSGGWLFVLGEGAVEVRSARPTGFLRGRFFGGFAESVIA